MLVKSFRLPNHNQPLPASKVTYPTQLSSFSIDDNRNILYNNKHLSFYYGCSLGEDLNIGFNNAVFNQNIEHLDSLLQAIDYYGLDWWNYNLVTFRGLLTKLTTALYNYEDDWCMNCMLLDNTVFVSDNSPPAQPSNDWHKRAMYHGYAFEHFSTSTSKDVHVNNSIQWATVNKLRIGNHKILTAGEVDCARASTDIDTYEPLQKDYIELKTSMQIHTQQHQDRFDKKLLKFYFQSYLLGVPVSYLVWV